METIDLTRGRSLTTADIHRAGALPAEVMEAAAAIVADVRARGDEALRELCLRFDGACPERFLVPREVVEGACELVGDAFLRALEQAHDQVRDFHGRELRQSWFTCRDDGTILGVRVGPVASAGVYVPGGRAQYPSTVLMNVVPAKVAGVGRVAMVTPPQADGSLSAYTLAAAAVAGVDEVYAVGGAQAIAALAYGTASIAPVDKICGPGNAYVAAAKRLVSGDVGIDMVAGPSEVCILADGSADAAVVAADLMAQAEHDPMATCYLVTTSAELAGQVERCLGLLVPQSPRAPITERSLDDHGIIVLVPDLDAACGAVDVIAPEHLELHCADAMAMLGRVHNAGAIFVGPWSSEPLGDYVAGPNHTLPTGGTARFSNPLSVDEFLTSSSVICYSPEGLMADAEATQTMAQAEGLWAHALSVGMRRRLVEQGLDGHGDLEAACAEVDAVAWPERLPAPGRVDLDGRR